METRIREAPAGDWEMPDDASVLTSLGQFVMAWSLAESTVEVCIAKQLGLTPLDGSIVTAGLQFRSRQALLASLLARDTPPNTAAIAVLKEMGSIGDRNDILHSVVGGSKAGVWFNRRKTGPNKFTSKIEKYDASRLKMLVLKCSTLASDLMAALDVSADDYKRFFQESHNAVNSDVAP
ncbi:hypothetical protein EJV44_22090 [Ancylobacter aquaticus]|nr:hypothetical protein EJV44_22090 [Ancylobacter aquaticus]